MGISAFGGLSRFDGVEWQTFTVEDGLAGNLARVLMESSDGSIWIGTEGDGLTRFRRPEKSLAQVGLAESPPLRFGSDRFFFQFRRGQFGSDRLPLVSHALLPGTGEPWDSDCDDLTALYCALLENAGISTALMDAPGHIFMLFDTGIDRRLADFLPLPEHLYMMRDGHLWLPVEITLFGQSFLEAWRAGAAELDQWPTIEQRRRVVDTAEAWTTYPPASPKFEGPIPPPSPAALQGAFNGQLAALQALMRNYIQATYIEPLQTNPDDAARRAELGRVYTNIHQFDRALAVYEEGLTRGDDPVRLYNDMGITYLLKDALEQAVAAFTRAVALDPSDPGLQDNLDIARAALEPERQLAVGESTTPESGVKMAEQEVDEIRFYWRD